MKLHILDICVLLYLFLESCVQAQLSLPALTLYHHGEQNSTLLSNETVLVPDSIGSDTTTLLLTFDKDEISSNHGPFDFKHWTDPADATLRTLRMNLDRPGISWQMPQHNSNMTFRMYFGSYSSDAQCQVLIDCTMAWLTSELEFNPQASFELCAAPKLDGMVICPLVLSNGTNQLSDTSVDPPCSFGPRGITPDIWYDQYDISLSKFQTGFCDFSGYWWQGRTQTYTFTNNRSVVAPIIWWPEEKKPFASALGQQALGDPSFHCTLASPCAPDLKCDEIGSRFALELGRKVLPIPWAYVALISLKNINQQLSNQYVALKGSAILATLRTFSIHDFWPKPKSNIVVLDILQSIASAFAIFGGFGGVVGTTAGQASGAIAAVSSYLGRHANAVTNSSVATEVYADSVEAIYASLITGLDDVAQLLFSGEAVNENNFTILDMIKGGSWIDADALPRVSDLEEGMRIEIISRSIDNLWKTPSSNKTFVTFVKTLDCDNDQSGPPDFKYCADDGVYYTYNFIEDGDGKGYVSWPWGADRIWDKLKIKPSVCGCVKNTRSNRDV